MEYFLGVDGGGSKTLALASDTTGKIIGSGLSPSSNYQSVGFEPAITSLDQAISKAGSHLSNYPESIKAICLGLAGVDRPDEKKLFEDWCRGRFPKAEVHIVNDGRLVLAAGTPDDWGIACISGTGSIVYGVNASGQFERSGGWGYLIGDEGSGYWIGKEALRAVVKAYDRRSPKTQLTELVLQHWNLTHPTQLLKVIYRSGLNPPDVAHLSILVEQAAELGDRVSIQILSNAASELCATIKSVCKKLRLYGNIPCALAGGVLTKGKITAEFLINKCNQSGVLLSPVCLVVEPAKGALRIASKSVGYLLEFD